MESLSSKQGRLKERLELISSAVVAFSGGVDSTFLLAALQQCCQEDLVAAYVESVFVSPEERRRVEDVAGEIGAELVRIPLDILSNKNVTQNTPDRCYHCKHMVFSAIKDVAEKREITHLFHGANMDDLSDFRPGLKAAEELGFEAPLQEVGLTKADIRSFSCRMGLSTWNLPSQSCLAARIAYGEEITSEKLAMVQKAETILHQMGAEVVRVRLRAGAAVIEVESGQVVSIFNEMHEKDVVDQIRKIGFHSVLFDMDGYRTGKMNNEIL